MEKGGGINEVYTPRRRWRAGEEGDSKVVPYTSYKGWKYAAGVRVPTTMYLINVTGVRGARDLSVPIAPTNHPLSMPAAA